MKIVTALLLAGLLCQAAPCYPTDDAGMDALHAGAAISVRLRRIGAEPFPLKIVAGVTSRDHLLAVQAPRHRQSLANGAQRWIYPVEPAMRGPTIVPPDAELTLVLDASGVVRQLRLHEPPLPRLALRNTPRPVITAPP